MTLLEQTQSILLDIVGCEPTISEDWLEVFSLLEAGEASVIIEFALPEGDANETVQWTLRDLVDGHVRYFDPASDEPPGSPAGTVLPAAGLPERRSTGDGHLLMATSELARLFQAGSGKALITEDVTPE